MRLGGVGSLFLDPRWFRHRIAIGVLLAVAGVVVCRRAFDVWGADLAQLYMSAWLWREGKNVYDMAVQHDGYMRHIGEVTTWGHFYPPGSAVALVPATLVSYPVAREIYFVTMSVVMAYGVYRFMQAYLPKWDASTRVLVIGLLLCTSASRWSAKVAQPATIVLGLFALFLVELRTKRFVTAFVCGAIVGSVKATFGMPFVLMAVAMRRFGLSAALVAFWVTLNLVGMYGMGGPEIIADYRANMATFERPDQLNYPDPRGFNSLARTDWPYLLNAISPNFTRNTLIGHALSALTLAWLVREVWRAKDRARDEIPMLVLSAPVACLSMLSVYHHHYDIAILFAPFLVFLGREEIRRHPAAWYYIVPVAFYAGVYPYDKFDKLCAFFLGESGVLISKPLGCAVCIVGLVASLVVLRKVSFPGAKRDQRDAEPTSAPRADGAEAPAA